MGAGQPARPQCPGPSCGEWTKGRGQVCFSFKSQLQRTGADRLQHTWLWLPESWPWELGCDLGHPPEQFPQQLPTCSVHLPHHPFSTGACRAWLCHQTRPGLGATGNNT